MESEEIGGLKPRAKQNKKLTSITFKMSKIGPSYARIKISPHFVFASSQLE